MQTLDVDDMDDVDVTGDLDSTCGGTGPDLLTDPGWGVPPVPEDAPEGTMAWLRARVARFSSGEAHARRRALATEALDAIGALDFPGSAGSVMASGSVGASGASVSTVSTGSPGGPDAAVALRAAVLRDAARVRTQELLCAPGPIEVMARVARVVPAEVLAASLGLPVTADTAGLVGDVARAYHAHGGTVPAADRALTRLVADCGGTWDEATAARIGLLVQAYDATAGLIGNAAYLSLSGTGHAPELLPVPPCADPTTDRLEQALRTDPPVRGTLRVPVDGGDPIRVGLVAPDGSLAFGAGAHACPGNAHARALAAGVLDALLARGCRLVRPDIAYEPSVNLRVPAALEVVCA
ncbi:hypothetical protein AB0B15_33365 [Streptomyces sp. NPDC045456]|uniref:hypothetical protein n=1 Tax=Streptomyces sp. NPDC045456 TaxID=3155254 RepID=UPI0033DDA770